jgi:hypothetical protein
MKSQAASRLRWLGAGAALVVALGAAACAATVDDKRQDDEITAKELSVQAEHRFRGPVRVVLEATRAHADPSEAQARRLRVIETELDEDQVSRQKRREKLRAWAVAIVRSGTASSAEFDRAVNDAVAAVEQRVDRNVDALVEIHGILDARQRKRVAAALRAKLEARFGHSHGARRHRGAFNRLAAQLMLDKLQLDKLRAIKKELVGERKRLRPSRQELSDLVNAFEGENFPSVLEAFRVKKSKVLRQRIARAGERTDSVLNVLSPEQRSLLADLIQDGPEKVLLGQQAKRTE